MRSKLILIVSQLLAGSIQAMPQFRNAAPSGTRDNPAGGFRPIINSGKKLFCFGKLKAAQARYAPLNLRLLLSEFFLVEISMSVTCS